MAFIDYGAIAFKNGKCISSDMFTPMVKMVGWSDTIQDTYECNNNERCLELNGNYFAYIGDKDITIGFYKEQIFIARRYKNNKFFCKHVFLNDPYYTWSKWEYSFANRHASDLKITKKNGYLVARWKYKGDKYKVYFGYGVDFNYYKKYRIVNYYRSPGYTLKNIRRKIEERMNERKYY